MSPLEQLRRSFAPHEIAAAAILIQLILVVAAVVFMFMGAHRSGFFLFLPAVAARMFGNFAVRCPRCGKSPLRQYLTAWGEARGGLPWGHRNWPERRCSSCGTELDIL